MSHPLSCVPSCSFSPALGSALSYRRRCTLQVCHACFNQVDNGDGRLQWNNTEIRRYVPRPHQSHAVGVGVLCLVPLGAVAVVRALLWHFRSIAPPLSLGRQACCAFGLNLAWLQLQHVTREQVCRRHSSAHSPQETGLHLDLDGEPDLVLRRRSEWVGGGENRRSVLRVVREPPMRRHGALSPREVVKR